MRLHSLSLASLSCVLAMTFAGCGGGPNGVRITEGQQERTVTAPLIAHDTPHIVHIDLFERIATIRNGIALGSEFLITTDYAGVETAVLKARPNKNLTLLAADILEGDPKINNTVKPAGPARSAELAKLYSIASEEN
jgi:hypothetical protein